MPDVQILPVAPRLFAAVRRTLSRSDIPRELIAGLDAVWPFVRGRGLVAGHNVALYRELGDGRVEMDCGVEVEGTFEPAADIFASATPAGTAAHATHGGPYERLGETYDAIVAWARANRARPVGRAWEIYGDWVEDPARLETDVFVLLAEDVAAGRDTNSPEAL